MVVYPKAMYHMSSWLHTEYELLALLQNTNYLLNTINSLTETPAPLKLIYPNPAYQRPQYLALGHTTMSSAMPNLHQCWHKKGSMCLYRRTMSEGVWYQTVGVIICYVQLLASYSQTKELKFSFQEQT